MPRAIRRLFATLLVFCEPKNVRNLWDEFYEPLSEDFRITQDVTANIVLSRTIENIEYFFDGMGRSIKEFDLPKMLSQEYETHTSENREVLDELAIITPDSDNAAPHHLNSEQKDAYDKILEYIESNKPGAFFIDGPGGTGKTYLYRALLATIRGQNKIAVATATSGVATSIMPGGRTAHSRFKISIEADEGGVCNISRQSGTAKLLREASIIIWDEAPMAKRWDIEALERTLRDILMSDILFGGKVIVFGGDFRQVLPVIPRATRAETVNGSLVKSFLWPEMIKLKLTYNMRASNDSFFGSFLLRVGDGIEKTNAENEIKFPKKMVVTYSGDQMPENAIINSLFPCIIDGHQSQSYITERAILVTRNETVDKLNTRMIALFHGEEVTYSSFDKANDDTHNHYPEEFLNTLTPNGLPPHELVLKINCPIMLLRNLSPSEGLCNGTRMVCKGFAKNIIHAEITIGQYAGKSVLLHRIPLYPPKNENFPFQFQRMQFPIRLCFAMTINKAQGQTIPNVGVYLPEPVFSHGQLYVALSRGTTMSNTKVLVHKRSNRNEDDTYTKNIVYKEVLTS